MRRERSQRKRKPLLVRVHDLFRRKKPIVIKLEDLRRGVVRIRLEPPKRKPTIKITKEKLKPQIRLVSPSASPLRQMQPTTFSDAYAHVQRAIRERRQQELIRNWRAHERLRLTTSPEVVTIDERVLRALGFNLSLTRYSGREFPFYMVEKEGHISDIFLGVTGTPGAAPTSIGGREFEEASEAAERIGGRVILGHSHPEGYGAIFSHVDSSRGQGRAGDDHAVARMHELFEKLSPHHIIIARHPQTGVPLLGVWRAEHMGKAIIHPWREVRIAERIKLM